MNKDKLRKIILAVSGAASVASLVIMFGIGDRETKASQDWSLSARSDGEKLSFSSFERLLKASDSADRVVIFTDMVVFEDRGEVTVFEPAETPELAAPESAAAEEERPSTDAALPAEDAAAAGDDSGKKSAETKDPERVFYKAELNYNILGGSMFSFSGVAADISFGTLPAGAGYDLIMNAIYMVLIVCLFGGLIAMQLGKLGPAGNGGAYGFIRAKDLDKGISDVAGLEEASAEAREMIEMIRDHGRIGAIGAKAPKGLLLSGPPGTGKTLIGRAMAKEAGLNFLSIDASALHQTFVGVGPSRVRSAFAKARKNAPCIVFIDEIDAVGSRGGSDSNGADKERDNLINALLVQMDGLKGDSGVFVVAATNRPDQLDPALVRPGRIDRRITIGLPNNRSRLAILNVHAARLPLKDDVDLAHLASGTTGMSGADLAALCNEAGIAAGREGASEISMRHFLQARQRMLLGQTGSKTLLSEEERRITAWHEAGHAIVATLMDNADPVEHVTILPRGGSLGHVMQVPDTERNMETKARLKARMAILAAGRAAEVIHKGPDHVTNGAASDIAVLTDIATSMVTKWGMGRYGFLRIIQQPGIAWPEAIATEIREMSEIAMSRADEILRGNEELLRHIAEALMERDTLSGAELRTLIASCMPASDAGAKMAI